MAERFAIDPWALKRTTDDVRRSGSRLRAALVHLEHVLTEHDGCEGTDEIGKAFRKGYGPSAEETRDYNGEAVGNLFGVADGVDARAREFVRLDETNAQYLDQMYAAELNRP